MKYKEFWKNYKNKSKIEKMAITSIPKAMKLLFDNLSKKEIIAVYIKGSFLTREMNEKSDVDIVPIVRNNRALNKLKRARDLKKNEIKPSELLPISLTELKKNKNYKGREKKGRPDTFLRDLEYYKLIYGKDLSKEEYPTRSSREIFHDEIIKLKETTLPLHLNGEFGFQQLIKQVFWIVYHGQKLSGKSPPRTWRGLNKVVNDRKSVIHQAYHFRLHSTKNKRKRKSFIKKLERYLDSIKM